MAAETWHASHQGCMEEIRVAPRVNEGAAPERVYEAARSLLQRDSGRPTSIKIYSYNTVSVNVPAITTWLTKTTKMKYSALSVIALAATAIAAPSKLGARQRPTECDANQKKICCATGVVSGGFFCTVQGIGSSCLAEAFCCPANLLNMPVVSWSMARFGEPKNNRSLGLYWYPKPQWL